MRSVARIIASAGLAAGAALALAGPASAGSYTVYSCKGAKGESYGIGGWTPFGAARHRRTAARCPKGSLSALLRGNADHGPGAAAGWRFDAPAGTEITGYRIYRSVRVARPSGKATPLYYLSWPGPYDGADTRERCAGPSCRTLGSARRRFGKRSQARSPAGMRGVRSLYLVVACAAPAGQRCLNATTPPRTPTARVDIHGARITLRDDGRPALTSLSGPLVTPDRVQSGVQAVTVGAEDVGGGVASVSLEIDGREFVRTPFATGCAPPYTSSLPCPLAGAVNVELDTRYLPDGPHALRVLVRDVAGNTVAGPASAFNSDNSARAALLSSVNNRWRSTSQHTQATRLSVTRVAPGTEIDLRCEGGSRRRCPFSIKKLHAMVSGSRNLLPFLDERHLRPGARIRIRITGLDRSVKLASYRVRSTDTPDADLKCRSGLTTDYGDCP